MEKKLTIQDLAILLSQRKDLSRKDAETFIRVVFDSIRENLLKDGIVKVKGLGTFKLLDVQERESVDVTSGRRILIPKHTKISFTPDSVLRDLINKPFADFQTVILNEDTKLEDMEEQSVFTELYDKPSSNTGEGNEQGTNVIEENTDTDNQMGVGEERLSEVIKPVHGNGVDSIVVEEPVEQIEEEYVASNVESKSKTNEVIDSQHLAPSSGDNDIKQEECTVGVEPIHEADDLSSAKTEGKNTDEEDFCPVSSNIDVQLNCVFEYEQKRQCHDRMFHFLYLLFALVLAGLSYASGYYRWLCPCDEPIKKSPTSVVVKKKRPIRKENVKDSIAVQDRVKSLPIKSDKAFGEKAESKHATQPKTESQSKKELAEKYTQVPGGKYLIVGTQRVHEMKAGDNLYKIARKEYGSNDFMTYIVVHNSFANPDLIPKGYKVKLPRLIENK